MASRLSVRRILRPTAQTTPGLSAGTAQARVALASDTATPIKHVVVIFQENVSFDHYFGTYPKAANTSGEPFQAAGGTPKVNNLADTPSPIGTGTLLTHNPTPTSAAPWSTPSGSTQPRSATW